MKPNAINYLSLARKAGRIEVGEEPVGACARAGHARLVLVAGDAPENTVRRARNFVAGTEQQMVVLPFTKDEMGAALGRSSVALAAMTDPSMALAFLKALDEPAKFGKAIADLEDRDRRARQHRAEEKAHERNLRTGKKRNEPEEAPKEQTGAEKRHFATQRIAAREEKTGEKRPYRKPDGEKRPYHGKPEGDKRPYHGKPEGDKRPYHGKAEGDKRPYHGKAEGEKRPFRRTEGGNAPFQAKSGKPNQYTKGGTPAHSLRRSDSRGPKQNRPAANGAAGRKFGRKTNGGAE